SVALGNIGPAAKSAVPALVCNVLQDKSLGVRVNTAAALGQIHSDPERVVPALVEAYLTDQEEEVRSWSILSISLFGTEGRQFAAKAVEEISKDPRKNQAKGFETRLAKMRQRLGTDNARPAGNRPARKSK